MRSSILACLGVVTLLTGCGSYASPDEADAEPQLAGKHADDPASPAGGTDPGAGAAARPGEASLAACVAQPACDGVAGPKLGSMRSWTHSIVSKLIVSTGSPNHRGRDQILSVGDAQWVMGKMTYSLIDKDLTDEEVDIFVERGCGGSWELLGTTKTTGDGDHATVDGVEDSGGRVFFQIPKAKELAPGRHRVRLVVAGDQTSTDLLIDVLPKGSPIVVSDVDGTLTSGETAEFPALLRGTLPAPRPEAADVLSALAGKGYHVVYLTARPEWLTARTHEFLAVNGFPPGIVHTTSGLTGATGDAAALFKSDELSLLAAHGHSIAWGFGNQPSDTNAYEAAKIPVDQRVFLGLTDAHGGRRIEAYGDILSVVRALAPICK